MALLYRYRFYGKQEGASRHSCRARLSYRSDQAVKICRHFSRRISMMQSTTTCRLVSGDCIGHSETAVASGSPVAFLMHAVVRCTWNARGSLRTYRKIHYPLVRPVGPAPSRGTGRGRNTGLFPAWRRSCPYQPEILR